MFETGRRQYERAASKKILLCGEQGYLAAARFLSAIDAPLADKLMWSNPAGFESATEDLTHHIVSPIEEASWHDLSPAETDQLSNWLAEYSNWQKQIAIIPETLLLKDIRANSRVGGSFEQAYNLHLASLLDDDERREHLANLPAIAGVAAAAMAAMFLALGLLGWLCQAISRKSQAASVQIGYLRAPLLFCLVLALTFGFLGFVTAYQPQLQKQPWPVGVAAVGILAVIGWFLRN